MTRTCDNATAPPVCLPVTAVSRGADNPIPRAFSTRRYDCITRSAAVLSSRAHDIAFSSRSLLGARQAVVGAFHPAHHRPEFEIELLGSPVTTALASEPRKELKSLLILPVTLPSA